MMIIGLTGSIAMGKSEVAAIFRSENIPVFDSDQAVHDLYQSLEGVALLQPIVPEAIINNQVDRSTLSAIVVKAPDILSHIEKVVHHHIAIHRQNFIAKAKASGNQMVVVDIPLLFEKNLRSTVDVVVVVSAPTGVQRQRALQRPGMTTEKLDMILAKQWPDERKRAHAHYIIENGGTHAELKAQTLKLIETLKTQSSDHA